MIGDVDHFHRQGLYGLENGIDVNRLVDRDGRQDLEHVTGLIHLSVVPPADEVVAGGDHTHLIHDGGVGLVSVIRGITGRVGAGNTLAGCFTTFRIVEHSTGFINGFHGVDHMVFAGATPLGLQDGIPGNGSMIQEGFLVVRICHVIPADKGIGIIIFGEGLAPQPRRSVVSIDAVTRCHSGNVDRILQVDRSTLVHSHVLTVPNILTLFRVKLVVVIIVLVAAVVLIIDKVAGDVLVSLVGGVAVDDPTPGALTGEELTAVGIGLDVEVNGLFAGIDLGALDGHGAQDRILQGLVSAVGADHHGLFVGIVVDVCVTQLRRNIAAEKRDIGAGLVQIPAAVPLIAFLIEVDVCSLSGGGLCAGQRSLIS